MTSLEGSSWRGEASRKIVTGRERDQSVGGNKKGASGNVRDGPRHGDESVIGPNERGQE